MVGSQIIRRSDDDRLMRCARNDTTSTVQHVRAARSPGDWGRGFAGRLGGEGCDTQQDRDRDRKRGFRDGGCKLAGWLRGTRASRDGWRMWQESSRLPRPRDYSFSVGDRLNRRCIVIRAGILNADSEYRSCSAACI